MDTEEQGEQQHGQEEGGGREGADLALLLGGTSSADDSQGAGFSVVLCCVTLAVVLSSFQFGYSTGVVATPRAAITCGSPLPQSCHRGSEWSCIEMSNLEWSAVVSIFTIGGLLGGSTGGKLADALSRKKTLLFNNSLFIVGGLLMTFAVDLWMLLAGRFLNGIGCGVATSVVPMYLAEVAPKKVRGASGTLNQLAITVGILVAQLLGIVLSTCPGWRYLLGVVSIAIAVVQMVLLPFCPTSPRWLLSKSNPDEEAAAAALAFLRGKHADIRNELAETKEGIAAVTEEAKFVDVFHHPLLKPLIVGIALQLAQQFSGINAVLYYATSIFQGAGVANSAAATATIGVVNVVMTIIATFLMDRAGRRPLILISQLGEFIFMNIVAFSMIFKADLGSVGDIVLVASVLLFVCFFAVGVGPIPWFIITETFPSNTRGYATGIGVVVNWLSNFIVAISFTSLQGALGSYTFFVFSGIILFFLVFSWFLVPETKGRSIEELTGLTRSIQKSN